MRLKKIALIFGTRPEIIKFVPIIYKLNDYKCFLKTVTIVTAQHRDMLDQFMNFFNIKPDYDLNIMEENQSL